jgi:SRSO17 transposase
MRWLEPLKACFGHRAQLVSLGQYVNGLLSDSSRKSMQAMLARVTDPVAYQSFHHFITEAPWDPQRLWRGLLQHLPERRGVVILDDTGFPKKGTESVGVARQYSGTLGKIGNCQVAVTATLWTGVRAWLIGAALYLPQEWFTEASARRRARARVPTTTRLEKKWQLALRLLRRARAAGLKVTAVLGDAGYGDVTAFRTALHRWRLPYALGISSDLTVFRGTPRLLPPPLSTGRGRRRTRPMLAKGDHPLQVRALAARLPPDAWHRITWHNGANAPRAARFAACRVTPAHHWYWRLAPEVWLLCERTEDPTPEDKFFLIHLPRRTALARLVALAHQRWAIEQQYQQLKTELGLDHFEGRTYLGWNRHVVLTAVAYAFLQQERIDRDPGVTFETIHAIVQEVFTGLLFATHPRYLTWLADARSLLPLRL